MFPVFVPLHLHFDWRNVERRIDEPETILLRVHARVRLCYGSRLMRGPLRAARTKIINVSTAATHTQCRSWVIRVAPTRG